MTNSAPMEHGKATAMEALLSKLPNAETMLTYANILAKPQYWIDAKTGQRFTIATGEIVEAACVALRLSAVNSHAALKEEIARLREALTDLIEAVRRDSDEGGKGISGYTAARVTDARSILSAISEEAK